MQVTDWSDLQAFQAIARAGQLAGAASLLGLDATTMGRRLRRLETRLGATLFERTRQGQVLTEAGEALLERVEAMARAASGIAEGEGGGEGLSGTLRISTSEGFGSWFLARRLHRFQAIHPRLTVDLVASTGYLSPSRREADIAILLSRPKTGPLIARKLSDYLLRLYATREYLGTAGMPEHADDLRHSHRLVGYIPDLLFAPELGYSEEIAPNVPVRLRSSSINAQHRLIAEGGGIGVLPCFIGDADPALVPVMVQRSIRRSFWLVRHRDTANLARVRQFCDWLGDEVARARSVLLPA